MEGNYCEARVVKKATSKDGAIKIALIALAVAGVIFTIIVGELLFLLITVGAAIACVVVFPKLKVEYEYVFCDGQLDFDRIINGEKRKHAARLDFDNLVVMAPKGSHALDGYMRDGIEKHDFTSLDADAKVWAIVVSKGGISTVYFCEPDTNMLQRMKQKAMRKFVEY